MKNEIKKIIGQINDLLQDAQNMDIMTSEEYNKLTTCELILEELFNELILRELLNSDQ